MPTAKEKKDQEALWREVMAEYDVEHNRDDREAVAEKILELVDNKIEQFDITSFIADVKSFPQFSTPGWKVRHGLEAVELDPGGYARRSTIKQDVYVLTPFMIACHPEMDLDVLQSGLWADVNELAMEAQKAILGKQNGRIWTTLKASIASTDSNYGSVASSAAADTKLTALNTAIDYVQQRKNGAKAIFARLDAIQWIQNATFSNFTTREVEKSGILGDYRGIPIVTVKNWVDRWGTSYITGDNIFVLSDGSNKFANMRELRQLTDIDVDHATWHTRFDKKIGFTSLFPADNYRLELT